MPLSREQHLDVLLRSIEECRKSQANESLPKWERDGACCGEVDCLIALQMDHPEAFKEEQKRMLERRMEMTL